MTQSLNTNIFNTNDYFVAKIHALAVFRQEYAFDRAYWSSLGCIGSGCGCPKSFKFYFNQVGYGINSESQHLAHYDHLNSKIVFLIGTSYQSYKFGGVTQLKIRLFESYSETVSAGFDGRVCLNYALEWIVPQIDVCLGLN